jgi:2-dehydropantoate 2-reductase
MSVLIVGAGATGGYYGACLQKAGRDVAFLVRPARAAQLAQRGLRLIRGQEAETFHPELVTAGSLDREWDIVIVTVKATGLDPAVEDFAPAVGAGTVVVPVLNGMAHLDALNARFGPTNVLGGVAKLVTQLSPDGDVIQLGPLASLEVGAQEAAGRARLDTVAEALDVPGFDFAVRADIIAAMWHKWVFIATVGALTTLMRAPVGEIMAVPGGHDLAVAMLAEAAAVSAAAGYELPAGELEWARGMVTAEGSPFASSMYRDMVSGFHVEVGPILGDMIRRADELGVDTPLLDVATMRLRIHENGLAARFAV